MDDHLGVRVCGEVMAAAQEFRPQLLEIVNFTIEHNPDRSVLIKHRLVASSQIDDTEAAHPEAGSVFDEDAFIVRAAVHDCLAHAVNRGSFNSLLGSRGYDARNSAHATILSLSR